MSEPSEKASCVYPCGDCAHMRSLPDDHALSETGVLCAAPLPFWHMKSLVAETVSKKLVTGPWTDDAKEISCPMLNPRSPEDHL